MRYNIITYILQIGKLRDKEKRDFPTMGKSPAHTYAYEINLFKHISDSKISLWVTRSQLLELKIRSS